ncbi:MAG: hypothetical protein NXI31_15640 [bacterium]|nr:hypothetical protein [bacterium]
MGIVNYLWLTTDERLPVWPSAGQPEREVHEGHLVVIWSRRLPAIDRALRVLDIERVHRRFERAELSTRPAHVGLVLRWISELHEHVRRGAKEGLGMLSFSQ